jgi:restriction system protein
MTTSNEFENFVYEVCKELGTPRAIVVHGNKTYHGRVSRRKISVDVSFDAQLLGAHILGLVECKCYKSRVGVSDVEEFHSKSDDIGAHKGIMFTTVGYQAGAKKAAKGRGIALFILREGQEPGEIRIERKSADRPPVSQFLRGNFLPWGQFSEPSNEAGYRVESADELFCLLSFSEEGKLEKLVRQQTQL